MFSILYYICFNINCICLYFQFRSFSTVRVHFRALNNKYIVMCRYGIRNSLFMAPMPTASTAQVLGNNESIEAYTSNIYSRRVLSGEFQVELQKF